MADSIAGGFDFAISPDGMVLILFRSDEGEWGFEFHVDVMESFATDLLAKIKEHRAERN